MSYKSKLKDIKAFVFDVDGVFTDGSIVLMPDGSMSRTMNVLDGYAVTKAIKAGYRIACITGGSDPMVKHRLNYLGITDYYSKSSYKLQNFEDFKDKYDLKNDEVLSMGDDIPDYDMLRLSAIGACPINAVPESKKIAEYISPIHGGKGCVRDVIEQVMKVQGKWTEEDDTASV